MSFPTDPKNLSSNPPAPKAEPKPWPLGNTIALALFAAALAGAVFGFVAGFVASAGPVQERLLRAMPSELRTFITGETDADRAATAAARAPQAAKDDERATIDTVVRAAPGVVSVIATREAMPLRTAAPYARDEEFLRQFFGMDQLPEVPAENGERQRVGSGTGFFVSEDGYIVTNRHVVADEQAEYAVIMADGSRYDVAVLARDEVNDIAVLKAEPVEGIPFPVVQLGSSSGVKVGQTVIAIGYALGQFGNTVSRGIVSGLQRSVVADDGFGAGADLLDLIQTDAAINPGNSGGPLLDLDGRAIGMNSAIVGGAQSIGFAIPIDDVRIVVESVRETGRIQRPFLGIRYIMLNAELAAAEGLTVSAGALVVAGVGRDDVAVMPGSAADKAGIQEGDIVITVDGKKLTSEYPLAVAIRRHRVGDTVVATILRDGEEMEVLITLEERS